MPIITKNSLIFNLLKSKLLQDNNLYTYNNNYNTFFSQDVYNYINNNIYNGSHDDFYRDLLTLKEIDNTLNIIENTDKKTFDIIGTITPEITSQLNDILRQYPNRRYRVISETNITIELNFGYLPTTTASTINLLADENLIDYSINGITLAPNDNNNGTPILNKNVCYLIEGIQEFSTVLILFNVLDETILNNSDKTIIIASLLDELRGTQGATLNRIIDNSFTDCFYEVGPYDISYLSTTDVSLVIQVPYDYIVENKVEIYVYDITSAVEINNTNNNYINHSDNWYIDINNYRDNYTNLINNINESIITTMENVELKEYPNDSTLQIVYTGNSNDTGVVIQEIETQLTTLLNNTPYTYTTRNNIITITDTRFIKNNFNSNIITNKNNLSLLQDTSDTRLLQYIFGDFIWKTSDAKLIAYAQNLLNLIYPDLRLKSNGIWTDNLGNAIMRYKEENIKENDYTYYVYDDVLDKNTEQVMIDNIKNTNSDFDYNNLFNEW